MPLMLALLLAVTLSLPLAQALAAPQAPPSPTAPTASVDEARAEFAAALDLVHAKLKKREWKAASADLASLLARHEKSDVARGKLLELEEIARLSAFWAKHPAPDAKTLLYGELMQFDRRLDTVKLSYSPGRLAVRDQSKSKRKPTAVPAFDTGEKPPFPPYFSDFEQVGQLTLHPLQFNGPYTIDMRARMPAKPTYVPSLVFLLDGDEYVVASFEYPYKLTHITNGGREQKLLEEERGLFIEAEEDLVLQASVTETQITVRHKGRRLLSGPKPKGRFGWFGTIAFDRVTSMQLSGKSYGQWLDALVDSAVESDRTAFDASFDPRAALPAWLYDVPDVAVRDDAAEQAAVDLVQRGVSADLSKRWSELVAAKKWAELLVVIDAADERSMKPLTRAWSRSQALFVLERLEEARAAAREVLAAAPKHRAMRTMEAAIGARLDDEAAAIESARALVRDFPDDADARTLLVTVLVRAGRFAEAQHEAESGFAAGVDRVEMAKLVKQSRRAVAGPPWRSPNRFESKHYVVASDMDRDTCVQLSKVLEETYAFLQRAVGPLPERDALLRAFVFSGRQAYLDYCEDLGVGEMMKTTQGLFVPALAQLLFWNAQDRTDFLETARHEAFHQYVHELVPEMPVWLNEGLAQYFQTLRKEKGQFVAGAVRPQAVTVMKKLEKGASVPTLAQIFAVKHETFYRPDSEAWYAMSWAVVHALAHGEAGDRALFDGLIARTGRGLDGAVAVRETFAGVDLEALRERVCAHARSL